MPRSKEHLYTIDIMKGELIILYNELFFLEMIYGNRIPFEDEFNALKTVLGAAWYFDNKSGKGYKPQKPLGFDHMTNLLMISAIIDESHDILHMKFTDKELSIIQCIIVADKTRFEREILWDGWDQFKGVLKQIEKYIGKMR